MISNILKYGIGIISDLTEIRLHERIFKAKNCKVKSSAGRVEKFENKTIITIDSEAKGVVEIDVTCLDESAEVEIEIHVASGSDIIIHEKTHIKDFLNLHLNLHLSPNTKVQYIIDQQANQDKFIIAERDAYVGKDATLEWVDFELGAKISKSEIHTHLLDAGANGQTFGLFYGRDKQVFDLYNVVHHTGSHTTSVMDFRGVLDDASKAVYRGLIRIPKGSAGCDGAQTEKTLLLSNQTKISAVPDLEIENNDVKCTHAVSTSRVDETSLFYLQSRGFSVLDAQKIIVESHLTPIISRIKDESIRLRILDLVMNEIEHTCLSADRN